MKTQKEAFTSLKGQFLIAMPQIDDLRFNKSVIYIYEHTRAGGAGIVINHPADKMSFVDILDQLKIEHPVLPNPPKIVLGGPDKFTNGFILHTSDYKTEETIFVADGISLTATQNILYDIARGRGPQKSLIALGCATWIGGQLEDELMSNVWLTASLDTASFLFDIPFSKRWETALSCLGIKAQYLSTECGQA